MAMTIKFSTYGLIMQLFCMSLLYAYNGNAQYRSTSEIIIKKSVNGLKIKEIFDVIESSSELDILFLEKDIDNKKTISIHPNKSRSVYDILMEVSKQAGLKFRQVNNGISVSPLQKSDLKNNVSRIKMLREVEVSGKVTDENGEGLPGASILVKGTTIGTTSDIEGNFSLNVPENATLAISFVGYKTTELLVAGRSTIDVQLFPDAEQLDEIVVVGYGTKKKGTLTGSTFSVGEEMFKSRPQTEVVSSLQGEIPGLLVLRGDGRVGNEGNFIEVRGVTSRSSPGVLIVIDGIPQRESNANALNKINPQDIEDITILKDGQAAIYGARAAGGVILVTTKKGKSERPVISYDGNYSFNVPGLTPKSTDVRQHMIMASEAFENDGNNNHFFVNVRDAVTAPGFDLSKGEVVPGPFGDTPTIWLGHNDWSKEMWQTAFMQSHNLNVSGSTENSNYYMSAGILDQESMLKYGNNSNKRYFARFKYDFDVIDGLLNIGTNISLERQKIIEPTNYGAITARIDQAWTSMPLSTPEGRYYNFGGFSPPHAWAEAGGDSEILRYNTRAQFNAVLTPLEGLAITGRFSTDLNVEDQSFLREIIQFHNWNENPSSRSSDRTRAGSSYYKDTHQVADFFATYNRSINDAHNIEVTVGTSHEETDNRFFSAARNYVPDALRVLDLGDLEEQSTDEAKSQYAISSYFSRLSYNFNEKYLFEINYRRDGSSRFAKQFRWGDFYGVSAGWVISNEDFLKNNALVNNLKLRMSKGQLGNQNNVGRFDHFSRINIGGVYIFGDPVSPVQTQGASEASPLASQNRTWEVVNINNFGLDYSILDSRLSGSVDYFIKNTEGILISQEFPTVLGIAPPTVNGGEIQTKGIEVALTWADKAGDFDYFIKGVYSNDNNTVTSLEDAILPGFGYNSYVEGYSTGSYFGYEYGGLITDQAVLDEYKTIQGVPGNLRIGDVMWLDKDGDGVLEGGRLYKPGDPDSGDLVLLDNNRINHQYSVTLGASYKGLDFNAVFVGVGSWKVMNGDSPLGGNWWEQPWDYEWQQTYHEEDRPNATWPKLTSNGGIDGWNWTTSAAPFKMYNNAYLRLRNLQVGYTFPTQLVERLKISSLRVYVSGSNLWEKHNLPEGFDPEKPFGFNYTPFPRLYSTGVNITF